MNPIIEFNDIHRAYTRGVDVLHGVTFSIEPGEVVGLLGKNGAGKTTLVRIAMGMIEAQKGRVSLFGMDPRTRAVEVKKRVGYVSEDQILPEFMRVGDIIRLHKGLFPGWDEALERELTRKFNIPLGAKIKSLSKGQARQVALLCAVGHKPELLILDEPAGGLDPAARREFLETSIQLLNEAGTTILFSSHYMSDVERLAGRIVMIHEGEVLIDTDMDALREGHSLVLVPHGPSVTLEALAAVDGCIGVRERADSLHGVFRFDPAMSRRLIEDGLKVSGVVCRDVSLEEMFIELAGGQ